MNRFTRVIHATPVMPVSRANYQVCVCVCVCVCFDCLSIIKESPLNSVRFLACRCQLLIQEARLQLPVFFPCFRSWHAAIVWECLFNILLLTLQEHLTAKTLKRHLKLFHMTRCFPGHTTGESHQLQRVCVLLSNYCCVTIHLSLQWQVQFCIWISYDMD